MIHEDYQNSTAAILPVSQDMIDWYVHLHNVLWFIMLDIGAGRSMGMCKDWTQRSKKL